MARSIWSGAISFGLVNVPVKLFTAVRHKEVRFHMLHDKDGGRIKQQRVCSIDGEEVPYENIVKGYEIAPDRYVEVTKDELEQFDPKATKSIDIEDFVDLGDIDPVFYESTYYIVPDKGASRAYALLLEAMKRSGKIGIARVVLRTKQYLCAVRPKDGALVMSTMNYADEIVEAGDIEDLPSLRDVKPRDKELEMAEQLIQSLSGPFTPEKYKDEYREKVLDLLRRKEEGEEIVGQPEEEPRAKVVNLMDALRASLKQAQKEEAGEEEKEERGERRHMAKAAHTARAKAPAKKKSTAKKSSATKKRKSG